MDTMFCKLIAWGLVLSCVTRSQQLPDGQEKYKSGAFSNWEGREEVVVGRKLQQEGIGDCTNEVPADAFFSCDEYADNGLCGILEQQFCRSSCGKCCTDLLLPGILDCSDIAGTETCNAEGVRGVYCNLSCGNCPEDGLLVSTHTEVLDWSGGCGCGDYGGVSVKFRCFYSCEGDISSCDYATYEAATNDNFTSPTQCDQFQDITGNSGVLSESDVVAPLTTLPKPTIQQQEAAALLSFKNSMQDDSDLLSWKGDNACSGWIGIDCTFDRVSNISLGDVAWNKNNSQYQALTQTPLISIEVATSVPNEWSILQNLVKIQMGKIGLTGTLPSWFSLFTRLEVFYMDDGYFSGSLPEEYSTLEDMVVFIVDNNQLTGTLPVSYTTWNKIGWIDANENRLIGSVPQEYSSLKEGANMLSVFPSTDTNFCTPSANLVTDSIESVVIC
eukprot:TRINITY_DN14475_c0_g1_i1.p2 TRINITY_DN14475_c0_g1~~TRINITY_DN14475_c0_g1_i1.p2  ORF type:complete len:443 (+),score=69.85 TRINITY_DN14475_c0_g1_i1:57-1385(+)